MSPSPDLTQKDGFGSSIEGTARGNTKKSKRCVDVFDKKHIEIMNRKYLDKTPKLEDNLKINRMHISKPMSSQWQQAEKIGRPV